MFQTSRTVILITVALIIAVVLSLFAVRIGSVAAKPMLSYLFTNPDGTACEKPCLLGIRPHKMSFRAAYNILTKHPLVEWYDPVYCSKSSGQCSFRLYGMGAASGLFTSLDQGGDNNQIVDIYLQWHNDPQTPTFGDALNALASPRYVIPHSGYKCCAPEDFTSYLQKLDEFSGLYGLTLYYDQLGIEVTDQAYLSHGRYKLESESPVLGLRVFQPYPICTRTRQYWEGWRGFGDVIRYFGSPAVQCS